MLYIDDVCFFKNNSLQEKVAEHKTFIFWVDNCSRAICAHVSVTYVYSMMADTHTHRPAGLMTC